MKAVVGVKCADKFCRHVCPNPSCGHKFPRAERHEWERFADRCCPECGSSEFKRVAGHLVPMKRFVTSLCELCSCVALLVTRRIHAVQNMTALTMLMFSLFPGFLFKD